MDIERLKEDIRNVEYDLEYGEEQCQGRIAVNVNCLRSVVDFANKAIARQLETEMVVCPECRGSGIYQEYDEYDRYYVHVCGTCDGSGEIPHQSTTNEEGHFPLEAEQEYNKLFEDKCIKTGLNLIDIFYPSSDDAVQAVQNAKTIVKKKYDDFRSHNIQGDCYKYVCSCGHCKQPLWEIPDYQYVKNERGHTPNYCPNCGFKLN